MNGPDWDFLGIKSSYVKAEGFCFKDWRSNLETSVRRMFLQKQSFTDRLFFLTAQSDREGQYLQGEIDLGPILNAGHRSAHLFMLLPRLMHDTEVFATLHASLAAVGVWEDFKEEDGVISPKREKPLVSLTGKDAPVPAEPPITYDALLFQSETVDTSECRHFRIDAAPSKIFRVGTGRKLRINLIPETGWEPTRKGLYGDGNFSAALVPMPSDAQPLQPEASPSPNQMTLVAMSPKEDVAPLPPPDDI